MIHEIDKNFYVKTDVEESDIAWFDINQPPFLILGITYDDKLGCYTRMPQEIAEQVSSGVAALNLHTSGGRVRFRTNSDFIGIHAVMNNSDLMPHFTLVGQSGFDLYRKLDGSTEDTFSHAYIPPTGIRSGYSAPFCTDGVLADYTINFPLYDGVQALYVALKKDATLAEAAPYRYSAPVVYYGSSITQGGCASRPGNAYQSIISRRLSTDYINLGFSGCGKAENVMAQYLASLKMSVFVCDYDHNAPDASYLKKTHLPLYRAVRSKQPALPIVFVSAPDVLMAPNVYTERREVIRETYQTALADGDENVYFIDGAELFAGDNWDSCTVDGAHPNDLGFYRMAMRIEKEIVRLL